MFTLNHRKEIRQRDFSNLLTLVPGILHSQSCCDTPLQTKESCSVPTTTAFLRKSFVIAGIHVNSHQQYDESIANRVSCDFDTHVYRYIVKLSSLRLNTRRYCIL